MGRFWTFKNLSDEEAELRIEGEIVSDDDAWIYEWFGMPATSPNAFRQTLAEHKGKNLSVWIDSWGGDVFAAAGIYNALKEHKGKVTVKIDGKAVSAASIIAMAGDEVLMSPTSIMMIHNPWTVAVGEAKDMQHAAEVLNEVKEAIINAYQLKTGLSRNKISNLMDAETWMSARTAIADRFADGMLYTSSESEDSAVQNAFSFSRLAIQNSANAAMKRFFDKWRSLRQEQPATVTQTEESEEQLEINNLEDLKKAYPDLCNQLVAEAEEAGRSAERERLKAIDEIASTVPQNLVQKAKYETPMSAQDLAFEALKMNAAAGNTYVENRTKELAPANNVPPAEDPAARSNKEDEAVIVDKIAAAANQKRKGARN
jgi:ATP-dependent Clp protease protease subunit